MKRIDSRKFVPSKVEGFGEVRFVLNKLTEGRAIQLNVALAPHKAELRSLMAEADSLTPKDEEDKPIPVKDPIVLAKIENIQDKINVLIQKELHPAWVKWGLKAVEGLEIDGEVVTTAEEFIESAPPELFSEVYALVQKESTLSTDESGN